MASDRATLTVSARDNFGSRASRRLRRDGLVPGVVYGHGGDARPFQVPARELRVLLGEGHTLLDLQIDGSDAVPVVIKEQQHHPLRGDVVHLDCLEVRLDEKIQSEVPIELEGADQAPGVREGGVLEHVTREVTVEALPTEIPETLTADVSEMVIGDTVTLEAVTAPPGVEFALGEDVTQDEITIATLSPPRVEEEPEPDLEEEAELVGEDGEPIEAPDGEEAPEGEGAAGDGGDSGGDESEKEE
jgi:large subunit ribosomal protein L25